MPTYKELFPYTPIRTKVEVNGVQAEQAVDTVLTADGSGYEWDVVAKQGGTVEYRKFRVLHDGSTIVKSEYAQQAVGGTIAGLVIDADLAGTGATQQVRLLASAAASIDVLAYRYVYD